MLALLGTAVTASFFDSLNPSAIAQQMLLQAMVKKKRHIWFFILGISLANIVMGLAIYYGITARLSQLWRQALGLYPVALGWGEIAAGAVCLTLGAVMVARTARRPVSGEGPAAKAPTRQLTPAALFLMGVVFCGVEITSALPYFGFLAFLAGYGLGVPYVLGFICLYTLVYSGPLILLYFCYNYFLQRSAVLARLEGILGRVSAYIVPGAVALLGLVLLVNGGQGLLR